MAAPVFFLLNISHSLVAQTTIEWQKTIGTEFIDDARKILNAPDGNIVIFGTEPHEDFTGNLRIYLMVSKLDTDGNEIWKKYHDVGFETNTVSFDYYFGEHFYTEQNGQAILNVVLDIGNDLILYKLNDEDGNFFSFEYLQSPELLLTSDNSKFIAPTECSVQLACYGPDSLTLQKINPFADSNFSFIAWEYGIKQNLRTAQIQGHYDFDVNDIAVDEDGNVYLLVQIERWDFLFCTDCNDEFVDSWNMLYKFSPEGELLGHERLNITTAVVSYTNFLSVAGGNISVRIDDINNQGTAVLSSIFQVDYGLNVTEQFDLDRYYNHMTADASGNIYSVTNVYDPNDPNIKGLSDVYVTKFNEEGQVQWASYYGGSSFDFPRGFVLTSDNGIAFLANTESTDFDVEENIGFQDMWLVKLSEGTTGVEDGDDETEISVYPNPTSDVIYFTTTEQIQNVRIMDVSGKEVMRSNASSNFVSLGALNAGSYLIEVQTASQLKKVHKVIKL